MNPGNKLSIIQDRGTFLLLDGNAGFGQVVAKAAMELAIARAREMGVAVVGLKNSYHISRVGAWAEMCAAAGFISIHYVNAFSPNSLVAPFGGSDTRFTTNPYCTALPASKGADLIVLDMATSRVAMGKVRVAHNQGVEMVPGDPERKSRAERLVNGIPIDDITFAEILAAGEAVRLDRAEAMRIVGN